MIYSTARGSSTKLTSRVLGLSDKQRLDKGMGASRAEALKQFDETLKKCEEDHQQEIQAMDEQLVEARKKLAVANTLHLEAMEELKTDAQAERSEDVKEAEKEIRTLGDELEVLRSPLPMTCGRGHLRDLDWEMMNVESMCHTQSPKQAKKMQLALLKYLYCIGKLDKEVKETDLICDQKMRVLRTDAAIYADVDVGIHIAKAKRLIGMYMDATEVDDKELQAMVLTIIDKNNCLRHLSIGGVVVRESKKAEAGVAAAVDTYEAMRQRISSI
jgi:hypothetical protein